MATKDIEISVEQKKDIEVNMEYNEIIPHKEMMKSYSDYNFTFNQENGKLELTMISNDGKEKTIEVDLPTEELVKNVNFDTENKQLVIEWENGQITNIPVDFMDEEFLNNYINNNSEKTSTLDIGTSATFNPESDEQIPTSKAVSDKFQPKLTEGEGISILGNEISISSDVIRNVNEIFEFEHTPNEQKEIYLGQTVNTNFPIWLFIIRKIPHDNGDGTYWYSEESGEYYIYFTENKINLYSDSEGEDISATNFLDGCSFGGKPYVENSIWFADNNIISVEISYVAGVFSKNYDM